MTDYFDEVMNALEGLGFEPLVNAYAPPIDLLAKFLVTMIVVALAAGRTPQQAAEDILKNFKDVADKIFPKQ